MKIVRKTISLLELRFSFYHICNCKFSHHLEILRQLNPISTLSWTTHAHILTRAPVLGTAVVFNCKRQEEAFSKAVNVRMPLFWSFLLTFTAYLWSEAGTDLKTWTLWNKTAINVRHCRYKSALSARNWSAFVVFSVVKARQRKHHPLCQKIMMLSIQTTTVCMYIPIRRLII